MRINNKSLVEILDIELMEKSIQPPSKNIIKDSVPFMNGSYDFSEVYGDLTYSDRTIKCKYAIGTENIELLYIKYTQLLDLLMTSNELIINFEDIPGYYFKGKVESAPSFDEISAFGTCTVIFICYPFKISSLQDGHDIWDTFNFELDMVQETKFEVETIESIQLYNNGSISVNPIIICNSNMEIVKGNTTYKFNVGETKSWSFKLDKGLNDLIIKGTGTIEFKWCKEVL